MSSIDWKELAAELPEGTRELVREVGEAYDGAGDDPACAVEKLVRRRLAALQARFEQLKGDRQ